MDEKIAKLQRWVSEAKRLVFFGGAGVSVESGIPDFRSPGGIYDSFQNEVRTNGTHSTESGIPDFRGVDGLYRQKYAYPPETILSHDFFKRNTAEFYRFYRDKMLVSGAKPNPAHLKLAQWEQEGRLSAVVTQNIDGLHFDAGSKRVYELHGSVRRNYCSSCHRFFDEEAIRSSQGVPRCTCGGVIKPDVVLYGEGLDNQCIMGALRAIANADMLIVGGTSLSVYPAAGLIDDYRGNRLVLINMSETPQDRRADLIIREPIGRVFAQLP